MRTNKTRKRFGCATAFLLFLVLIFVYVDYMSYAKYKMAYTSHVADYLVEQKRKNGKWPDTLGGFAQSRQSRSANGRTFHNGNFQNLEIIQSDAKSCRFRLHLKGFWVFYPRPSIETESTATIE